MEKFKIETERLARVSEVIGRGTGDISDALMPDLKHLCEILARIQVLQEIAPGFVDEMFSFIPHFLKLRNKAALGQVAQKKANEAGFGAEWRAAIDAGKSPKQKDYLEKMVALQMKAKGVTQAEALRMAAEQLGKDENNLRRTVTRSKKRKS